MAEAHQAVVFAFNITDQGVQFEFDQAALQQVWRSGVRAYKKRYARFKNQLSNGIYPAKPGSLLIVMLAMVFATIFGNDLSFGYVQLLNPTITRFTSVQPPHDTYLSCLVFACAAWLVAVMLYKALVSALLRYHGWMYEAHGRVSGKTKLWAVMSKLLISSKNAGLFSFQAALPRLPLPPVTQTVSRYLTSMQPLLSDEEMSEMRKLAGEFERGVSKKLQFYLRLKSWWAPNYVSDWWEEYVYLYSRDPIMVNSNYYGLDAFIEHPTKVQAARAANTSWSLLQYWRRICREELPPIMSNGIVPLCSWQYERQFATTRIPGEEKDRIMHLSDTRHLAVYHAGRYYKVYFHHGNRWLEPCELEQQLQQIIDDKCEPADGEKELAVLTAGERKTWARARKDFFSRGVNKASLDAIERAAFVLVLDDEEADFVKNGNSSAGDAFAKSMLHGNGYNRWFDKSFNLVVFANGRIGFNAEHSWADAPILGQSWEEAIITYDIVPGLCYDDKGHCKGRPKGQVPNPIRLQWEINSGCKEVIGQQLQVATDLLTDVDLHLLVHKQFGKGAMKSCRVSPDAFIQLALQLAYFRDSNGQFCLTYEASMTRMFKEGRTETVRSCTNDSAAFVRAMESGSATKQELVQLMRKATDTHQKMYRDAMTGKGVDRHLFTLYVVSKYCKVKSPFLEKALHCQWKLSTSQTPHGMTEKLDLRKNPTFMSAGGGFGPVSNDGYGVSYIIVGEDLIFFHISSRVSCELTNSHRFGTQVSKAMSDLLQLYKQA